MRAKNRNKRDLRLQLPALYLLFVTPIFVLIFIFFASARQRLQADVTAADLSLARAIALETDALLIKAKGAVVDFAHMPVVIQADPAGMGVAFAAGAAARQDINLFYRLSAEGIMIYHYPPTPRSTVGRDFSFRDYFQAAQSTRDHVFSKGRISPTTKQPVVTSMMPVFKAGHFDGVVATDLELQRFTETIIRIGLELPLRSGLKITIVDAGGQVIAHSEPADLLENIADTHPGIYELLTGPESSITAQDRQDVAWLYTYTPISEGGWGVIVQRPTHLAFASLDSLQRGLVLAFIIFSMGALIFWAILFNQVINPLVKLTRYSEGVGQETLTATLDRETILPISQRSDQIGRLTQALLRAEHDVRQRLVELTTLNKTSAAVASTLDTQQVINTILNEVQRLLQVRQCTLLVMNETTQQLEIQASRGLSQNYVTHLELTDSTRKFPAIRAITSGQPVQVSDIETETDLITILPTIRAEGYRSLLAIPLTAPHVPPAALVIYRTYTHHFSEQEIGLATSFANQAAMALEHATLFSLTDAELQKRVRFLSALNQVGHTVSQSLVMDDILNNAINAVFEVMAADACWIYLQRETESLLRLRAQRGFSEDLVEHVRSQAVEHGQGVIGAVAQHGLPLHLEGHHLHHSQWSKDAIIVHGSWQSLTVVPLQAKETIIGVLGMATKMERTFTEVEVELLQAIGQQITIAVVNARLYRRSHELATLEERNRMAREIHDTLAQGFTGILVQLQAAERLSLKRPEQALQSLQEARELARESLQEARRSALNLRPTILENLTLDRAIAQQAQRFEIQSGLKTSFFLEGYPSPINPGSEQNLYRITQEALTNARRHAQATCVTITLTYEPKTVTLTITDDGIGLKEPDRENGRSNGLPGTEMLSDSANGGFGLVSIQERVDLMRGQVTFKTRATGGTQIKAVIPK